MRRLTHNVTAVAAVLTAQVVFAQTPMKPTAPGTPGDPAWQGFARLSDGRTFVTDGGLAIDAALAKPATLPGREVAGKVLQDYLAASHKEEFGFGDLTAAATGKTYTTPSGIPLSRTYIDFLRRTLPSGVVRFRMNGEMQPVVIVANGTTVGVLMPVRK